MRVTSAHGQLVGIAATTEHIDPDAVAISHGFVEAAVNRLTSTNEDVDPLSGQIAQTGIPVRIEPA